MPFFYAKYIAWAFVIGGLMYLAYDYRDTKAKLSEAKLTIQQQKTQLKFAEISREEAIDEAVTQRDRESSARLRALELGKRPDAKDPAPAIIIDAICGLLGTPDNRGACKD